LICVTAILGTARERFGRKYSGAPAVERMPTVD
jgi:hypothetical protein